MSENFRKEMERLSGIYPNECSSGVKIGEVYAISNFVRHPEHYDNILSTEDITRMMYFDKHVDACGMCSGVLKDKIELENLMIARFGGNKEPEPS